MEAAKLPNDSAVMAREGLRLLEAHHMTELPRVRGSVTGRSIGHTMAHTHAGPLRCAEGPNAADNHGRPVYVLSFVVRWK